MKYNVIEIYDNTLYDKLKIIINNKIYNILKVGNYIE